jgi:hypothetical protein
MFHQKNDALPATNSSLILPLLVKADGYVEKITLSTFVATFLPDSLYEQSSNLYLK